MHPDCLTEADIRQMDPLFLLRQLSGYYERLKDAQGKRLGPLVGYAGKYDAGDGVMKQYVGDVYANYAKAEEHPIVLNTWASMMEAEIRRLNPTVVMGMPMGGILSAFAWASVIPGCRCIFAEKKVTQLATEHIREQSKIVLGRHEIRAGDRVLIGEDVCNNFATTAEAIQLIQKAKAVPVGISCWLNRSAFDLYHGVPVRALVNKVLPEYMQEDAQVAVDIAAGNVVWKPKDEWGRLMAASNNASA